MNNLKVENMENAKGREVVNQFLITDSENNTITFQSYKSTIATYNYNNNKLTITNAWDYSKTTSKYLYEFISSYVYGLKDMDGLAIWQGLANANSKKAYINRLIDTGIIDYIYIGEVK